MNGKKVKKMVREPIILMVRNMKVNGKMVKKMVREPVPILMVTNMKVNLIII